MWAKAFRQIHGIWMVCLRVLITGRFPISFTAISVLFVQPCSADALLSGVPTGWLIQQYVGAQLSTFNAGSSCAQGSLNFTAAATSDEKNRYISMVVTAKAAGRNMRVYYETSTGYCYITSFGIE